MEILQATASGLWDIAIAGALGWVAYALAKSIRDKYAEVYHFWMTKWTNG